MGLSKSPFSKNKVLTHDFLIFSNDRFLGLLHTIFDKNVQKFFEDQNTFLGAIKGAELVLATFGTIWELLFLSSLSKPIG